jgi:tetratricopeptide (TPR) repeat protein
VSVFPDSPQVLQARLQLGECYRALAKKEHLRERAMEISLSTLPDELKVRKKEEIQYQRTVRLDLLREAYKAYQQLADELEALARKKQLADHESILRRRAWLGVGECHLDDEHFVEALRIFQEVQVKNRRTLEAIFASKFVYYVYEVMQAQQLPKVQVDRARDLAKESLRLLVEDVQTLPKDQEAFRKQWLAWADEKLQALSVPPKIDGGPKFQ